jgi:hypothetical protein
MLSDIIPEIIEEPIKAGCAPGNETIGYLAGEISRLRAVLKRITEVGHIGSGVGPRIAKDALTPPNID